MKRELINFIATIGLVLLGGALVLGLLTGALFIFPNLTIFGAKAVNERDTQIRYQDAALADAFANGKFILESTGTRIEVKMSNDKYDGEGEIVVNESATGIAFNSLGRTLIEWTQTIYNEELYYRIKVLEPSGMVFSQKPTTVYINLPHRAPSDTFRHDFVLQNHYSAVNFSFVDTTSKESDALKIGNLVVESAAQVNIPSSENISLNNVEIKSNHTQFVCQSPVAGNVEVTGSNGEQTFNTSIGGRVTIKGGNNRFHGDNAGDVHFENGTGSLSMNDVQKLTVETTNANISVNHVVNGVTMTTEHGNLWVGSIDNNGLKFTAGNANEPFATASVTVANALTGNATVVNHGTGGVNLYGVNGDVIVRSSEVGGGNINVGFKSSDMHSVSISGYDGNINVSGINGTANITVRDTEYGAGAANIYAQFNKLIGTANRIMSGGYVSGHDDWGNVVIELDGGCNNFDLYVYGARSAKTSEKYGFTEANLALSTEENKKANPIIVTGDSGSSAALEIYCQNQVYLS